MWKDTYDRHGRTRWHTWMTHISAKTLVYRKWETHICEKEAYTRHGQTRWQTWVQAGTRALAPKRIACSACLPRTQKRETKENNMGGWHCLCLVRSLCGYVSVLCIHAHTIMHACAHARAHIMHTHVHASIHTHTHTQSYAYMMYTYIYVYI